MAKKIGYKATATLKLNPAQGGAWQLNFYIVNDEGIESVDSTTSWKTASAAKRHAKALVLEHTPRKSIKMIAGEELDVKGKPTGFSGTLEYRS